MSAPATSADFLDILRRSHLVEAQKLHAFLQPPPGPDAAPAELADRLVQAGLLTRFQVSQLLQGKWKGFSIGKYRVLERIGFGGMGQVYLAEHKVMRRKVAIKVLPLSQARNVNARERFYREARAAGALAHPNLVRAYDVDSEGHLHFLVMEYVDGASLQDIVARHGPLAISRVAHYLWQAALGLQHAHEADLVHRDIKPANLILDRTGVVKILDLGLARFFTEGDDGLTNHGDGGAVLGTADFLAPEQAVNSHEADIRSDIYGLGATAYFLLTGKPPFPDGTVTQKLIAHQMRAPTPLREQRPDVPDDLAAVVAKMLAKDPADRYQTPAEVAAALEAWATVPVLPPPPHEMPPPSGGPAGGAASAAAGAASGLLRATVHAGMASSRPMSAVRMASPTKRSRKRTAGVGLAAGVLLAAGGTVWWTRVESAPPLDRASASAAGVSDRGLVQQPASQRPATESQDTPGIIVVEQGGSLAAAVSRAKPGERIILRGTIEEAVSLAGGVGAGVRIEGDGDKPTIWKAPADHDPAKPLLGIDGVEGLTVANIAFDGDGRAADLVVAHGRCFGLTLRHVEVRNFTTCGIMVTDGGDAARPVLLNEVRAVSGNGTAAGLSLGSADAVHVRNCRFEGPSQAAVRLSGPVANVEFSGNRVWQPAAGLRFETDTNPVNVVVRENTFFEVATPLSFQTIPPVDKGSTVVVQRNLFAKPKQMVRFDTIRQVPETLRAGVIWTDEADAPSGDRFFRKTFDVKGATTGATLDVFCNDRYEIWLNGQLVGKGTALFHAKRVECHDVSALIKQGRNVLAVKGGYVAPTGERMAQNGPQLVVRITLPGRNGKAVREVGATDGTWKAAKEPANGWEKPDFDDAGWASAKLLKQARFSPAGTGFWESEVRPQVGDAPEKLFAGSTGNVQRAGQHGWRLPEVAFIKVLTLPQEPADDGTFLRYAIDGPLVKKFHSPGAGPVGK
jgi:serine/threonine protein kinase